MPVAPVTFAPVTGASRTGIDRAGDYLRAFWLNPAATGYWVPRPRDPHDEQPARELLEAFRTLNAFREAFQLPLNKTAMGLRSMVRSEWPELRGDRAIPVTQRLKRREQILRKLARYPDTKLSNMGDVGGCRAILQDRDQVDRVMRRIRKNWPIHGRIRDTRDEPRDDGYRALHVIVVRDGRRVEIQLRTPREHEWAVAVERTGVRLGIGLKEGEGPADLREYFSLASYGMYLDSMDVTPDQIFTDRFEQVRDRVRPYFTRRLHRHADDPLPPRLRPPAGQARPPAALH
jgi:putative GTP pyrophosphokinase